MRVIAGSAKGKKLLNPEGSEVTRPTTDRVKEAVFGSLQFVLQGSCVLDLFAGSGALGIEALSRGAAYAVFVDNDARAIELVRKNIINTGFAEKTTCICKEFKDALEELRGRQFDCIFLDPPYQSGLYEAAIEGIIEYRLLAPNGRIVAEHDAGTHLPFQADKVKKYGKTKVSYLLEGQF